MFDFFSNEYLPKARDDIACRNLPNGEAMYQSLLKCHTTTDYTPQQIHDLGISEVARIKGKMIEIMRR